MRLVDQEKFQNLLHSPSQIRNICIMAHVDHGKTTLADSLVASNGIISQRMAGKLRYMDCRKDEQQRGITMKSSSIALHYLHDGEDYLINLIDSPGHVDFSSEVSTAVRLCDGAVIVVDVVEGVCPQTQVCLKQAWLENIKPVLVLNKIDRLILEMKLAPLDAYVHITQVLEQINAVMGELFTSDVMEKKDKDNSKKTEDNTEKNLLQEWSDGLEEADDSTLYFSPDQGNVVFASAVDCWGFRVADFAKMYSSKLGLNEDILKKTIWGDYYINSKTKKVMKGAQEKAKKPLFVQLVLENIWSLYETICVRKDKEKLGKIIESLGVKVATRDLRHTDPKVPLQAVLSQWLPLSGAILKMVCEILPPANQISDEKAEKLMCSKNQSLSSFPKETQELKEAFLRSSASPEAPLIVFISKMFPVERKLLPGNRPHVLTAEELAARREQARLRHAEKALQSSETEEPTDKEIEDAPQLSEDVFIAFARVYSGTLKKGQKVFVLGPKHDPAAALSQMQKGEEIDESLTLKDLKSGQHVTKVTVSEIYLMMGRELEILEEAPVGNVIGIGGLEDHVLKSATISNLIYCPSFSEIQLMAVPILRVALETKTPSDLPALVKGLKLLNQADACVQVLIQETGEHVIVTAGEVHLERCLNDLIERYAKVPVIASEPIVPFRETVVPPPTVDMVNEVILDQAVTKKTEKAPNYDPEGIVTMVTANRMCTVKISCRPLPERVTTILEASTDLLKALDLHTSIGDDTDSKEERRIAKKTLEAIQKLKSDLKEAFSESDKPWGDDVVDLIWSFGPRRCGPNILLNKIEGYEQRNVWKKALKESIGSSLFEFESSFLSGFQLATLAGPLCDEPMMGVAFIVHEWTLEKSDNASGVYGPLSGQIMSSVKEGCRKSFQAQPQRLMAAMYSCSIQVNAEVLGKMYAVLGRRQGRVLHGDQNQGSASFNVTAVLPVIESFSFSQEIRKQTSGLASPQLVFSHWEVIDLDPFWVPSTEEEYAHYGEKADTDNRARLYMNSVRRRKGLPVHEKIVEFAEKQRTLSKKK